MKHLDQFTVAGISVLTTNENNQAQMDISQLWEKFFEEGVLHKIPNRVDDRIYAVYTDYESDYTKPYRFIIGCAVTNADEIPTNLTAKIIPAANYEVFPISKNFPEKLIETWHHIWQADLNRVYTADFEVYPEDFDPKNAKLEVYVSIK